MARRATRGYGPRGTSYTEIQAKKFANQIKEDLQDEIQAQLVGFAEAVVNDLTSNADKGNGVSPVLTGFFASSWKASRSSVNRTDERQNHPKWARIQYKGNRLLPGNRPVIERRHPMETDLRIDKPVFIGNTAKYAPYAVVSPKSKINSYLQGGSGKLKNKIHRIFTARPDIRVGGRAQAIPNPDKKAPAEYRISYTKQ